MKKTVKKIICFLGVFVFLFSVVACSFSASALSGDFYTGNGYVYEGYDIGADVIPPLFEMDLVLFNNLNMDNYYTNDVIHLGNSLIAPNYHFQNGELSHDHFYPWQIYQDYTYPSQNNLPTFNLTQKYNNDMVTHAIGATKFPATDVENPNKTDFAFLVATTENKVLYEPGLRDFVYPQYYGIYAKDFLLASPFVDYLNGSYGIGEVYIPKSSDIQRQVEYYFTMEYINILTGEEGRYTYNGTLEMSGNRLFLSLMPTAVVNTFFEPETDKATYIYIKNCQTMYKTSGAVIAPEADTWHNEYINYKIPYIMYSTSQIGSSDIDFTNTPTAQWNVDFNRELMPEYLANLTRYNFKRAEGGAGYTNFIGTALRGVLEPDIFGTFGIGDVLGIIIAFGVVMGFLKFFAGG